MKLISIQVGKPRDVSWRGKTISTGIFKDAVSGPVKVGVFGLDGDGQADLSVHGGKDKAVYAYGWDSIDWWKKRRPQQAFVPGIFGENLTFTHLDESTICAGDVFAIGTARIQAAEPRFPCFKLGIRFDDNAVISEFTESRRPGIYFRTLVAGVISPGDELKLIEEDPVRMSILEMFELYNLSTKDQDNIKRLLSVKSLSSKWRRKFSTS